VLTLGTGTTSEMLSEAMTAPLLDHSALDLDAAERITYVLEQSFHYAYDQPIEQLRQRLVVLPPPRHGDQYRRAHRVEVTGASARRVSRQDRHGNTVLRVHAPVVEREVRFGVRAVLERVRRDGPARMPATALRNPRLLRPTRLTAPDQRLAELAARLAGGDDPVELAERICATVYAAIDYVDGVTSVHTTAAQALAGGQGVCQDSAHVMLALCRLLALPARYVSGHLLGQGGTHAWVEVIVPDRDGARAVAFDPCNGCRADSGYLTIATGRDYTDVAPTSGHYRGTPNGTLRTSRTVGVLAAA
jgi:transglutaminase-like putative cysteine protease